MLSLACYLADHSPKIPLGAGASIPTYPLALSLLSCCLQVLYPLVMSNPVGSNSSRPSITSSTYHSLSFSRHLLLCCCSHWNGVAVPIRGKALLIFNAINAFQVLCKNEQAASHPSILPLNPFAKGTSNLPPAGCSPSIRRLSDSSSSPITLLRQGHSLQRHNNEECTDIAFKTLEYETGHIVDTICSRDQTHVDFRTMLVFIPNLLFKALSTLMQESENKCPQSRIELDKHKMACCKYDYHSLYSALFTNRKAERYLTMLGM